MEAEVHNNNGTKTIDLNGFTLTFNNIARWRFSDERENFTVTFKDSSPSKTGKLENTKVGQSTLVFQIIKTTGKFTLITENGTYHGADDINSMFRVVDLETGGNVKTLSGFDFFTNNAIFIGGSSLIDTNVEATKTSLNLVNFSYLKHPSGNAGSTIRIREDNTTSIGDIFDTTYYNMYLNNTLQTDFTRKLKDATATEKIEIVSKTALVADPIILPNVHFGYSSNNYNLNIKNNSLSDLELVEVRLSNDNYFKIEGALPSSIGARDINSSLKLKVKEGAGIGSYNTTITGVDNLGNEYDFGNVSFEVLRAPINPTISISDWTYEDTPSQVIINNNPSDGQITYIWRDLGNNNLGTKPDKPGKYTVEVRIERGSNYEQFYSSGIPFEIFKKEVNIESVTISDKYYNFLNPGLTPDLVNHTLNITSNISKVTHVQSNFNATGLYAGSDTAKVWISIKDEFQAYYKFSSGNVIEQIIDRPYNILESTMGITLLKEGLDNNTTTPISVRLGESIDLKTLFDLEIADYNHTVQLSLLTPYSGVGINETSLETELTALTGTVGIRIYFPGLDINSDGQNEYSENFKDIYIRLTSKEEATISGLIDNQTFNYNKNPIELAGTLVVEDDKVPVSDLEVRYTGVNSTVYDNVTPPTNVGTYQVTYKIKDTNEDYYGSVTYSFEIKKVNEQYILPSTLSGVQGNLLSTVIIPGGKLAWEDSTLEMNIAGAQKFNAYYTPNDTENYNIIYGIKLTVYVKGLYDVSTTSLGNGTVAPSVLGNIEGDTVEIVFTPNIGYEIDEVTVNGSLVTVKNNKIIFTNITENKDVIVSFKKIQFNIVIKENSGLILDKTGTVKVNYATDFVLSVEVKLGYKLLAVFVNEVDVTSALALDKLTLDNVLENKQIRFEVEKIEYEIIEGADQEVLINNKNDLEFKVDADFKLFASIYINGNLLDPVNYTVTEGSTIITLKEKYLASLPNGKYNMTVLFTDGGSASTNFTINRLATSSTETDNPNTADSIYNYITFMIFSLSGLITATLYIIKIIKKEI